MSIVKVAGPNTELVRRMFEAGESMNVNNFAKFYADDAHAAPDAVVERLIDLNRGHRAAR